MAVYNTAKADCCVLLLNYICVFEKHHVMYQHSPVSYNLSFYWRCTLDWTIILYIIKNYIRTCARTHVCM